MEKDFGYVQDVCADLETGRITSIIVPGSNKILNIFASNNEIIIPWEKISCIGDDLILVELNQWYFSNCIYFFNYSKKTQKNSKNYWQLTKMVVI